MPRGWMHTGDLATMDDEGYCNIVGRIKDMVIRGGENVYPREIEEFLYRHPKIQDVQVFGVPDERYGEELCAWIKLRAGETLTAEEVRAFCRRPDRALQGAAAHPLRRRVPDDGDRQDAEIHHARADDRRTGRARARHSIKFETRGDTMHCFNLKTEEKFDPKKHVERVLGRVGEGDVTVACWEPGQVSPYHCHPNATEIYFCFEGGGTMKTPTETVEVVPGSFVVHPPGELHEWNTGPRRARFCSACATATSSPAARRNGRATRTGSRGRRMSSISRRG